ncbi:MAG: T9SS type A sorting domain-containing protein [Gemmatimonadota bacterium]|nr:MAG: T9SS type A sorting domain-containing protein [Gemmatimonadota bacterium]
MTLTVNVGTASAVDMTISGTDLKVADVSADGLVEWVENTEGVRIAAASEKDFSQISITFERLVPGELELTARIDEGALMGSVVKVVPIPTEYALEQNYPNPFNPFTDIRYQIADSRLPVQTTLKIYNILGQQVRTLVDEAQEPGYYTVTWDARDDAGREFSSGIYFYRLNAGQFTQTKRMVLMK